MILKQTPKEALDFLWKNGEEEVPEKTDSAFDTLYLSVGREELYDKAVASLKELIEQIGNQEVKSETYQFDQGYLKGLERALDTMTKGVIRYEKEVSDFFNKKRG